MTVDRYVWTGGGRAHHTYGEYIAACQRIPAWHSSAYALASTERLKRAWRERDERDAKTLDCRLTERGWIIRSRA